MKYIILSLVLVGCGNQISVPEEVVIRHEIVNVTEVAATPIAASNESVPVISEPQAILTPEAPPIAIADLSPAEKIPSEAAKAEVIPEAEKLPEGRCYDVDSNTFYFARELVDGRYETVVMIKKPYDDVSVTFSTEDGSGNQQPREGLYKDGLINYAPAVSEKYLKLYGISGETEGRLRLTYTQEDAGITVAAWIDAGKVSKRIYACLVR